MVNQLFILRVICTLSLAVPIYFSMIEPIEIYRVYIHPTPSPHFLPWLAGTPSPWRLSRLLHDKTYKILLSIFYRLHVYTSN